MRRPRLVTLVRHAESERNKIKGGSIYFPDDESRRSIRGIPDHKIDITGEGEEQSRLTGLGLRKHFGTFDYAYHSGYLRTERTLDGILKAWPARARKRIQVRSNVFVRERDAGHAYDMTTAEAEAAFPWLHEYWKTFGGFLARPPGGESLADVVARVHVFLNTIFRDRSGKSLLVVTHGGTVNAFRFLLERWTYEEALLIPKQEKPGNCGVTVYEYSAAKKRLVLKDYNTIYY